MRIEQDTKLDFQDVLLRPKRSTITTRKDVDVQRFFSFRNVEGSPNLWKGIPLMTANMASVTNTKTYELLRNQRILSCFHKGVSSPDGIYAVPTFGLNDEPQNVGPSNKFICLDVANGYMEKFVDFVQQTRKDFPKKVIIAGNVVTPEMTEALILAGADIVKVGIGSGGACSTRVKTGVGYPQLSAVIECADAAHGLSGHVVSDGGCQVPGDVVKAFAAGADFVMLGSMLAGHDENGEDFYGSASERAVGLRDYRASEGWELKLPKRGPIENTIQEILGGLRSACAYIGARRIKDLPKCATFVRVNRQNNQSLLEYRQ